MLHTQQKEYLEVLVLVVERAVLYVLVIDVVVL